MSRRQDVLQLISQWLLFVNLWEYPTRDLKAHTL